MTTSLAILVGSTLGNAEYLADHLQEIFNSKGISTSVYTDPDLADLPKDHIWLICTSTHGAGDLPDNIQPFHEQLIESKPDLSQISYGMIALGDSQYDTFCQAGKTFMQTLDDLGASLLGSPLFIDVIQYPIPEDALDPWLDLWLENLN